MYFNLGLKPEDIKEMIENLKAEGKTTEEILIEVITKNNQEINSTFFSNLDSFKNNLK